MTWESILKAPNPYGGQWQSQGQSRVSKENYYKMGYDNKRRYHIAMQNYFYRAWKPLREIHQGDELNPKAPMYNELKDLHDGHRFHSRQLVNVEKGLTSYYDIAEEAGRYQKHRLHVKPTGKKLEDLTEEEYNAASREEKYSYHNRRKTQKGHNREKERMRRNPNYTAPYVPSSSLRDIEYTKEQYEQMSDKKKGNYHQRMSQKYKKSGKDEKLRKFYYRMYNRFIKKINLPMYFSPEDEANA